VRATYIHNTPQQRAIRLGVIRGKFRLRFSEASKHNDTILRRRTTDGPRKALAIRRLRTIQDVRRRERVKEAGRAELRVRSRIAQRELDAARRAVRPEAMDTRVARGKKSSSAIVPGRWDDDLARPERALCRDQLVATDPDESTLEAIGDWH
jgi:hypothetical protein